MQTQNRIVFHEMYNKLPKLTDASDALLATKVDLTKGLLPQVEQRLKKLGLDGCVGVWIPHRHHELKEGEAVVESYTANTKHTQYGEVLSYARVEKFDADSVIATRFSWTKNEQGKFGLEPLEYAKANTVNVKKYEETRALLEKNPAVVQAVAEVFEAYGMIELLGLRFYDDYSIPKGQSVFAIEQDEQTESGEHRSVTRWSKSAKSHSITAFWSVDGMSTLGCFAKFTIHCW